MIRPRGEEAADRAEGPPARRNLPLADQVRDLDAAARPILAVWEITLACDLACGHCGSRAGRARPDELTTAEALDLVDQLAELGVIEVVLIGGESYLRDDWCEIIARIARARHGAADHDRRPRHDRRARARGEAGRAAQRERLDRRHARRRTIVQRGVPGSFAAALAAMENLREAGVGVSANTQINRLSMPELAGRARADHRARRAQLADPAHRRRWGAPPIGPSGCSQPYDLLELFPMLERLAARCDEADVLLWPGNNVGYFGPYESTLRGTLPRGHHVGCGAGVWGIGIEADGTIKGCPSLATATWGGGNVRDARARRHLGARRAAALQSRTARVDESVGLLRELLLRRRLQGRLHVDVGGAARQARQQPDCHHRALELQRVGKRERLVQIERAPGRAVRSGPVRADRRRRLDRRAR